MQKYYYRWLIVIIALTFQAIVFGLVMYSFSFWVVSWSNEFNIPPIKFMLIYTLMGIVLGLYSPIAGYFIDRFHIHNLISIGLLIIAISLYYLSKTTSFWLLAFIYTGILPIGVALTSFVSAQLLVMRWFTKKRGIAIGIVALGTSIGGIFIPVFVTKLMVTISWREVFLVFSFILTAMTPFVWIILKNTPKNNCKTSRSHSTIWALIVNILFTKAFLITIIMLAPIAMIFQAIIFTIGLYAQNIDISQGTAASLISFSSSAAIIGKLFFGKLSDNIDHRYLFWLAGFCMIIALLILALNATFLLLFISMSLLGFSAGCIIPMQTAILSSRFELSIFGKLMGIFTMITMTSAIGPTLIIFLKDVLGEYQIVFFIAAISILPSILCSYFLPKKLVLQTVR